MSMRNHVHAYILHVHQTQKQNILTVLIILLVGVGVLRMLDAWLIVFGTLLLYMVILLREPLPEEPAPFLFRGFIADITCPNCQKEWKINTLELPRYIGEAQECLHCGEIFVPHLKGEIEYTCRDCRAVWKEREGTDMCPICGSADIANYSLEVDRILIEKRKKEKVTQGGAKGL